MLDVIKPDWPAPTAVTAFCTTRSGGVSVGGYAELNLAMHVDDDPVAVMKNRQILAQTYPKCEQVFWMQQVHGTELLCLDAIPDSNIADAAFTTQVGQPCAVLTADCLPVLFCDRDATVVAAVHAGWRGLIAGILPKVVAQLPVASADLLAWIGPGIGYDAFEIGPEVAEQFIAAGAGCDQRADGRYFAHLAGIARQQLSALDVACYGGDICSYTDPRCYSVRRQQQTGRMASIIYLNQP